MTASGASLRMSETAGSVCTTSPIAPSFTIRIFNLQMGPAILEKRSDFDLSRGSNAGSKHCIVTLLYRFFVDIPPSCCKDTIGVMWSLHASLERKNTNLEGNQ